jgi:UDP:flavonoid glycosyltransferase YjiC (YdhE family)
VRLAESGAGLAVAPQDAAERLPAALHRLFTEPSFTACARRIAVEMAGYPPANEVLERLRETTMHAASLRGAE